MAWVNLGVELDAVGGRPVAKGLHLEDIAFGEQLGAGRQAEAFAMPLVDHLRPSLHQGVRGRRHPDRIVADLGLAFGVKPDRGAKVSRQHLGAKANPQIGLVLGERHLDPLDLVADEVVRIIDAHRPAENDGARVHRQRFRERVAKSRPTDVHRNAAGLKVVADAAGSRLLLMQHDQNGPGHDAGNGVSQWGFQTKLANCR